MSRSSNQSRQQKLPQLPDAEFEIMQIIWDNPTPITSGRVDLLLSESKTWHVSTVKTLLRRLVARGFLSAEKSSPEESGSQKSGKELLYTPLVSQDDYLRSETEAFMEKFHKKSLRGLMRAMYADKKPSDEDIAEIEQWFKGDNEE